MYIEYSERGLQVMPILPRSKRAFVDKWNKYSFSKIEEPLLNKWSNLKNYGYGLIFGRASNVVGVDIDLPDDMSLWHPVLKKAFDLIPPSICTIKGQKYGTRLFKWSESFLTFNKGVQSIVFTMPDGSRQAIEFRLFKCQSILPPSIHPDLKKPYKWIGFPIEKALDDLESLDIQIIHDVLSLAQNNDSLKNNPTIELRGEFHTPPNSNRKCPHGSHDRLKTLAASLVARRMEDDEAIRELLKYDNDHHKGGTYFLDDTRGDCTYETDRENAKAFYLNIKNSINRERVKKGLKPEMPVRIELTTKEERAFPNIPEMPIPNRGGLKTIIDEINNSNYVINPNYGIGSALTLMATVIAGRYRTQFDYPGLIAMLIGPSSSGKDAAMKAGNKIFMQDELLRKFNLYGPEDFSSSIASFRHFAWKRFQHCSIDESSSLFRRASHAQSSIPDVIKEFIKLYSIGDGFYDIREAVYRENIATGCYGPVMNLLFAIQTETFIECQTKELLAQGFLNRCLYFRGNENPEMNISPEAGSAMLTNTCEYINSWYGFHPLTNEPIGPSQDLANGLRDRKANPIVIMYTEKALKLRESIRKHYHQMQQKRDISGVLRSLYSKGPEQIGRIALNHCVSIQEVAILKRQASFKLDVESVEYGKDLFDASTESSHLIVEQSTTTGQDKLFVKLMELNRKKVKISYSRLLQLLPGSVDQKFKAINSFEKEIKCLVRSSGANGKGQIVQFLGTE